MTLVAPGRRTPRITAPKVAVLATTPADKAAGALTPIGGRPLLWHTLMQLSSFGMRDFLIATDAPLTGTDRESITAEAWRIENVPASRWLDGFCGVKARSLILVECAGLADIDADDLLSYHRSHGRLATIVAVRPAARFGRLEIKDGRVLDFAEKPPYEQGWVGAGICVLEPGAFDYFLDGASDGCLQPAMALLAQDGQLMAYKHDSFWGSVETLKDRQDLEKLWQSGNAPWKNWD